MVKIDVGGLVQDALEIDATNKEIKKQTGKARSFESTVIESVLRLLNRFGALK